MTSHYTFVDIIGSRIFHRYWDGKESKLEVTSSFPIELFIKGRQADSTSIYGEKLSKINFTDISDAREFVKEHSDVAEIYGQTSFAHQFIAQRYPGEIKFSINHFKIVGVDIETEFDETGFPKPALAAQKITSISCKIFGKRGYHIFSTKPFKKQDEHDEFHLAGSETEMLAAFLGWWNRTKPDIMTGWNIIGFDVPYLVNRLTKVLGESQAAKLSPFHTYTTKVFSEHTVQGDDTSYRILGITIFDYLELYKKFTRQTQEKYSLDHIAGVELNEAKLDYSGYKNLMDLWERNPQKYIEYNIHDVRLVEKLDDKMKYLFLAITIGYIGKVRMHEIFGQVKFWDNVVYNSLLEEGKQIPPQKHGDGNEDGIEGAYVKVPIPGLYKWLASLDLTSLYPSILMALNMSPETLVQEATDDAILDKLIEMSYNTDIARQKNMTFAANGSGYSRDHVGLMPAVTAKMFASRSAYKKRMISVQKEKELIKAEITRRGLNVH